MFYSTRIIVDGVRGVNMWLAPTIIAAGRNFNVKVWMDNSSITDTGEVDLYFNASTDEELDDFCCWLRNTYEIRTEAA